MTKRSLLRASVVLPVECCSLTAPVLPSLPPQCLCCVDVSKNVEFLEAEAAQVTSVRLSVWLQVPTLWFKVIILHQWLSTWGLQTPSPPQHRCSKDQCAVRKVLLTWRFRLTSLSVMSANTTKEFQASKVESWKRRYNNLCLSVWLWSSDISVQHLRSWLLQPAR